MFGEFKDRHLGASGKMGSYFGHVPNTEGLRPNPDDCENKTVAKMGPDGENGRGKLEVPIKQKMLGLKTFSVGTLALI